MIRSNEGQIQGGARSDLCISQTINNNYFYINDKHLRKNCDVNYIKPNDVK